VQEKQIEVFYAVSGLLRPTDLKIGYANVMSFSSTADMYIDFSLEAPDDFNFNLPFDIGITYDMLTSSTGDVGLRLAYEIIDRGQATDDGTTGTLTATITPPTTALQRAEYNFTLPSGLATATTDALRFRLSRDTSIGGNYPANWNVEDVVFRYTGFGAPTSISGSSGFSGTGVWFDRYTLIRTPYDYSATPASTSTITTSADMRPIIKVGFAMRYKIGGTYYYGMVTAITASLITIAGAPLSGTIQELSYGKPELIQVAAENFFVAGLFSDFAENTLFANDMKTFVRWNLSSGYLVKILVRTGRYDSGGINQPRVNVTINNNPVATTNSNAGLTIPVSATWTETVVDINTSNYAINYGDSIEISTDGTGTNGDAENLTVGCIFVLS
jgi:hypothetical protein